MPSDDLPAFLGGPPVRSAGPPPWPPLDPAIEASLHQAFADRSWGQYFGPNVARLEDKLRELQAVPHVLTCASGSYAIELALHALKLQPGDEIALASYDFPGNFLSIHAVGAIPVLVDIRRDDYNLSLDSLREALNDKVKSVLVSHVHGGVVPMRELMALAQERGLTVIEDACQCPGAMIQGRQAGSWGDLGILSFGGSKLLSAGRGGALVSNRDDLFQRARSQSLRGNFLAPLSELQAAVLLPQLDRLEERNRIRRESVRSLGEKIRDIPGVRLFKTQLECEPGYYKVGLHFDSREFGLSRALLIAAARAEGIALSEGFPAAHVGRSPRRYRQGSDLAAASDAHSNGLTLHHPVLLEGDAALDEVAACLLKIREHTAAIATQGEPR